eukprot:gene38395-43936_t
MASHCGFVITSDDGTRVCVRRNFIGGRGHALLPGQTVLLSS